MPPRGFRLNPRWRRCADTGGVEAKYETWVPRTGSVVGGVNDHPGQPPIDVGEDPNLVYHASVNIRDSVHENIGRLWVINRVNRWWMWEGGGTLGLEKARLCPRRRNFHLACYG